MSLLRGDAMTEWQPIETAPKMKNILLFAVTDIAKDGKILNWKMETGFYHTGYEFEHDYSPWNWGGRQLRNYDAKPTHWMLLPEPPK